MPCRVMNCVPAIGSQAMQLLNYRWTLNSCLGRIEAGVNSKEKFCFFSGSVVGSAKVLAHLQKIVNSGVALN